MNSEERLTKQKELVEEIGRYFDKEGFQPIAGRILSLLMVMDKEHYTFEEIVEELRISKSSASNALKNLEVRGDIEYLTLPGDRKRYFRMKKHKPVAIIEDFENKMLGFKTMTMKIVELKADKNSANARFLSELINMMNFFLEKMSCTKSEFEQKH